MILDIEKLFAMQKALDDHIAQEHDLEHVALREKKCLALQVELGELANETRCFKFWSLKPASATEVILEEYVDGLHFILSLGLDDQYEPRDIADVCPDGELTDYFLQMFAETDRFHKAPSQEQYSRLFATYLALGKKIGFTEAAIDDAYKAKNDVNHERQESGY